MSSNAAKAAAKSEHQMTTASLSASSSQESVTFGKTSSQRSLKKDQSGSLENLPALPQQFNHQQNIAPSGNSKRGVSANHLLSFTLPPREKPPTFYPPKKGKVTYQPYNKEKFVNANFRFIMSSLGDYSAHLVDPDALVPWNNIEQVIIPTASIENCTVCLCQPVAPKAARCGHVFCYVCILHYLALGEKSWRPCPICYDHISKSDLRSVLYQEVRDYGKYNVENMMAAESSKKGYSSLEHELDAAVSPEKIVMKLMQRSSGSINSLPRAYWNDWAMTALPCCDSSRSKHLPYAKLLLASAEYVQSDVLDKEQATLLDLLDQTKGSHDGDLPFIEMAVEDLKMRYTTFNREKKDRQDRFLSAKMAQSVKLEPRVPLGESPKLGISRSSTRSSRLSMLSKEDNIPIAFKDPFTDEVITKKDATTTVKENPSEQIPIGVLIKSRSESQIIITKSSPDGSPPSHSPIPFKMEMDPVVKQSNETVSSPHNTSVQSGIYHFYQAADGQFLFLHPLDIKILKSEYGNYANFPDEICVKINVIEETTLNEDLRKRYKYLSHLPLSCDVSFCEVDWGSSRENLLRNRVTKQNAADCMVTPSEFAEVADRRPSPITDRTETNQKSSDNSSPDSSMVVNAPFKKLVSGQTLSKWNQELKLRAKKHVTKFRKEEKMDEKARRRRNSSGTLQQQQEQLGILSSPRHRSDSNSDMAAELYAVAGIPSPIRPPIVPDAPIFDFYDEQAWKPLTPTMPTASIPNYPRPPKSPQRSPCLQSSPMLQQQQAMPLLNLDAIESSATAILVPETEQECILDDEDEALQSPNNRNLPSFASVLSGAAAQKAEEELLENVRKQRTSGGKKKKASVLLMSSSGGHRGRS